MKLTVNEILNIAKKYIEEYETVAIRTQDVPFELGDVSHNSKVWDNNEELNEELNGISATLVNSRMVIMHSNESTPRTGYYFGNHVAIICGIKTGMGEDEGEVILKDAEVLEILS